MEYSAAECAVFRKQIELTLVLETEMRLKNVDGPLSVHNGNPGILNSPKRINTLQNSNVTSGYTSNLTAAFDANNSNDLPTRSEENLLNNIKTEDTVQWCSPAHAQQARELTNNVNNRNQLFNINNTLAVSLRNTRRGTASSICSESSPDDSLVDYEDAHQGCSSVDTSPQEEDRGFDISDSESLSEDGNLTNRVTLQRRGIVNPNYPGFQHLAHTLDYSLKASSDTDFTDDDFECESLESKLAKEANNINNNNNNNQETDYSNDQIDSVNRLDSVENIQKVFYDKPVLNIPLECESLKRINCDSEEASTSNSNPVSDDDLEVTVVPKLKLNIRAEEIRDTPSCTNIIGDFGKEVEKEFGRITRENYATADKQSVLQGINPEAVIETAFGPIFERVVEQELEEAIEKLSLSTDLKPTAAKYNIEPNIGEPFDKCIVASSSSRSVFQDSKTVQETEMSSVSLIHVPSNENLKRHFPEEKGCNENLKLKIAETNGLPSPAQQQEDNFTMKLSDAFLSGVHENIPNVDQNLFLDANLNETKHDMDVDLPENFNKHDLTRKDSNREVEEHEQVCRALEEKSQNKLDNQPSAPDEVEKFCKEDKTKDDQEKDEDSAVPRKKEKMEINYVKKRRDYSQQIGSLITIPRRDLGGRNRDPLNRRSVPATREKKRANSEILGGFDVYNIETAMPKIDLEAIESHLRAAREEERRRRTDREEIRRRLAMGAEDDYYNDRPGRKPSLQARLQSGMNLQICFMNETVSDTESPSSDSECPMTNPKQPKTSPKVLKSPVQTEKFLAPTRPATLMLGQPLLQPVTQPMTETDFFARQARLQTEARMALAQAKEMARMQMEIERQKQKKSPITEMVRHSMEKVGIPFPEDRRRLSRQILTEMNVAQLQVIVNDLHTQIETLNENLVKFLMDRDDLHMEQDSMLVDIEDLTRYLGAKEQTLKDQNLAAPPNNNIPPPSPAPSSPLAALNSSVKPHLHRIASLVKK